MRFSAAALLAFAASAIAQTNPTEGFNPITKPVKDDTVAAGKPFEITWQVADEYKDLKVDIALLGGNEPTTLVPLGKIATGIDNAAGTYTWEVDSKLGNDAKYGLSISNAANPDVFQYSFPFNIKAADGGDSTVTMTMSQGVKTVILSSSIPTTTSTPTLNTTTICYNTTTMHNSTTMHKPTITSSLIKTTQPAVTTTQDSTPVPTPSGAGAHVGASFMAAVGGVAVALFAL